MQILSIFKYRPKPARVWAFSPAIDISKNMSADVARFYREPSLKLCRLVHQKIRHLHFTNINLIAKTRRTEKRMQTLCRSSFNRAMATPKAPEKIVIGVIGAGGNTRLRHIPELLTIENHSIEIKTIANRTEQEW